MMDGSFYVLIMFLIFLKLMIWLCVFYARARQRRLTQQRGIIIIQGDVSSHAGRDIDGILVREHIPGFGGGIDNPAISNPPSYEEVERTKSMEEKPPAYDQVIAGGYPTYNEGSFMTQNSEQLRSNDNSTAPPQYRVSDSFTPN